MMQRRRFLISVGVLGCGLSGCLDEITATEELDGRTLEKQIHARVNERRSERELRELDFDANLAGIARAHSKDMASNGFFSHRSPTNGTIEDRYAAAGYTCQVDISDSRYATGGENIAKSWYQESVDTGDESVYLGDLEDVADHVVDQWMNSSGHRENLLQGYWQNEGIGVAVTKEAEGTAVYVTQNFC